MKELIPMWIFTFVFISGVSSFRWENCGPSTNPIKINNLWVTQKETFLYVSLKGKVAKNITQPIQAKTEVKKFFPFLDVYIRIPCINNVGTCTFDDICEWSPYKNESWPHNINENSLPLKCPIEKKTYLVQNLPINLNKLPKEILEGTYKINIKLFKWKEELLCLNIKITL